MNSIRILVVDDYRDNTDCLANLFRRFGCEVEIAYDGFEALAKATAFQPHVALIDVAMPGLTGLRVAQQMRADGTAANTLLVAMSGYVDTGTRELARIAGFDRFLAKPFSLYEIREIIGPLCRVARYEEHDQKRPLPATCEMVTHGKGPEHS